MTRCHKCRDLTAPCLDCMTANINNIEYSPAPVPVGPIVFHGPQFGVSQAEYDTLKAENEYFRLLLTRTYEMVGGTSWLANDIRDALVKRSVKG